MNPIDYSPENDNIVKTETGSDSEGYLIDMYTYLCFGEHCYPSGTSREQKRTIRQNALHFTMQDGGELFYWKKGKGKAGALTARRLGRVRMYNKDISFFSYLHIDIWKVGLFERRTLQLSPSCLLTYISRHLLFGLRGQLLPRGKDDLAVKVGPGD